MENINMDNINMETIIESFRRELKRVVWRLQNKERARLKHEVPLEDNLNSNNYSDSFSERSDQKILVQQLFNSIPSATSKKIIYEIYFNNKSEAQVAKEMNISQPAVHKLKKKTLQKLRQNLSS